MTDKLTQDQVRHIAQLARLNCTDQEIATFTRQLADILDYAEQLNQLDTENVEPLAHCLPIHNVFRPDKVQLSLINDQALANAFQREGAYFVVPKIIEHNEP